MLCRVPGYDPVATAGDCRFDVDAARKALDFFLECLVHVKGELAGQPLKLAPWQKAVVANLFGWKRPDGTRRYREALIFVARKNGKTTLAAGLVLLVLFTDGEPGAEVYSSAGDKDQAAIIYDVARHMVEAEPELARRARIFRSPRSIVLEHLGSSYKPISSEASTKHGYNAHFVVNDELHTHKDRELIDVLETSTGARRQPLVVHITTAGFGTESICREKYTYACNVRDGIYDDPSFLPVIFEALPDDDWTRPSTWRKANPNLGVSVKRDYIADQCEKARELPSYENTFRRLHLNQWTQQAVRWLPLESWDACELHVTVDDLAGRPCWGAVDLSSTTDVTAFLLLFPLDSGRLFLLPIFFIPQDNAHVRELRDKVPYLAWAKQGLIELTPGNVVDYERVRARVHWAAENFDLREIAIDRWNATHLITELDADALNPIPFGQGYASMSAPSKELEKLVIGKQLAHDGHRILRWMAGNVTIETDAAENIKPSKKKSTERIDGIVAAVMALGRYMQRDASEPERSVYEDRGLLVLG